MGLQHGDFGWSWKPGPRAIAAVRRALDLVFPPQGLDGSAQAGSIGLGAEAWSRVQFIGEPLCDGCGAPFEYAAAERCAACLARPRAFGAARAACLYDEHSRDLILKFKHADRLELAGLFAGWIARAGADLLVEADAVAPVPLHRSRLLHRRYNQAAEIARPLARRAGLTYLPDALVRTRNTGSQGGKSGSGRVRNVSGAFSVTAAGARRVEGRRVLLVDDVLTTGATAEACAKALLKAGAARVDLAVIARVREAGHVAI